MFMKKVLLAVAVLTGCGGSAEMEEQESRSGFDASEAATESVVVDEGDVADVADAADAGDEGAVADVANAGDVAEVGGEASSSQASLVQESSGSPDSSESPESSASPESGERLLGMRERDGALLQAAQFELTDTYGERIKLADYRGRVVALQFWAVWCTSCDADLSDFQTLHEKYGDRGIAIIGIAHASGSRLEVREFADSHGVTYPMLLCHEEVRAAYDVAVFPTTVLIDREGNIRLRRTGRVEVDYWDRAIKRLIEE